MTFVLGAGHGLHRLQDAGRSRTSSLAPVVVILGHGDLGVAELIGRRPRGEASLVHQGGDGPPEGVRREVGVLGPVEDLT